MAVKGQIAVSHADTKLPACPQNVRSSPWKGKYERPAASWMTVTSVTSPPACMSISHTLRLGFSVGDGTACSENSLQQTRLTSIGPSDSRRVLASGEHAMKHAKSMHGDRNREGPGSPIPVIRTAAYLATSLVHDGASLEFRVLEHACQYARVC